jgi:phosphate acetyltransferase
VLTAYRTVADGAACPRAPMLGDGVPATAVADAAATAAAEVATPDVVVVEGSDYTAGSLAVELDFNVDAANHLGAPVLLVVRARKRTVEQVLDAVASGITTLRDRGCTLIGVVANRVDPR